jgi:hypothetical protein
VAENHARIRMAHFEREPCGVGHGWLFPATCASWAQSLPAAAVKSLQVLVFARTWRFNSSHPHQHNFCSPKQLRNIAQDVQIYLVESCARTCA